MFRQDFSALPGRSRTRRPKLTLWESTDGKTGCSDWRFFVFHIPFGNPVVRMQIVHSKHCPSAHRGGSRGLTATRTVRFHLPSMRPSPNVFHFNLCPTLQERRVWRRGDASGSPRGWGRGAGRVLECADVRDPKDSHGEVLDALNCGPTPRLRARSSCQEARGLPCRPWSPPTTGACSARSHGAKLRSDAFGPLKYYEGFLLPR